MHIRAALPGYLSRHDMKQMFSQANSDYRSVAVFVLTAFVEIYAASDGQEPALENTIDSSGARADAGYLRALSKLRVRSLVLPKLKDSSFLLLKTLFRRLLAREN